MPADPIALIISRLTAAEAAVAALQTQETRLAGARVYNNANITHDSTGNWKALTFNSERFDTDGIHSTSTNTGRLTCVTPGVYYIFGGIAFGGSTTGYRGLAIRLNNTTYIQAISGMTGTIDGNNLACSCIWSLAAGDYVELHAFQNSGGDLVITGNNGYSLEFGMAKLV